MQVSGTCLNERLKFSLAVFICVSVFSTSISMAAELKTIPISDLRVIVDISGSMKKTDPDNLRRPALRLIAGLIPEGSRAGIWSFGQQVNMIVKLGKVDNAWREQARKESQSINSIGLYTHIENAIRNASFDWKEPDKAYKRNLVLLTDGRIDISPDEGQNKISRNRIIKELLPVLEKAGVRVHTIALSDDVDESLLSTLSAYTGGLYKKVNNANDLEKIFLQVLEQSVKMDSLPIIDNSFDVDASVKDMTLLVFNNDKNKATKIVTPGKASWTLNNKSVDVNWFNDQNFDLITIKNPQQGKWRIIAPLDKNNRVVIATNLKLQINELPGLLMVGDILKINAQLEENNKPLLNKALLSRFEFSLNRIEGGSAEKQYRMTKSIEDNNIYAYQLPPIFKAVDNELVIRAISPTAKREVRHHFKVYSIPADINISEINSNYQVKVTPYANLLRPESVSMTISLNDKSQHTLIQHDKDWLLEIDNKYRQSMFRLDINANRADGKPVVMSFNKMLETQNATENLTLTTKKAEKQDKKLAVKDKTKDKKLKENDKKDEKLNWTIIIISIVLGNILLIGLFFGGYIYIKRSKKKLTESLNEEIVDDQLDK